MHPKPAKNRSALASIVEDELAVGEPCLRFVRFEHATNGGEVFRMHAIDFSVCRIVCLRHFDRLTEDHLNNCALHTSTRISTGQSVFVKSCKRERQGQRTQTNTSKKWTEMELTVTRALLAMGEYHRPCGYIGRPKPIIRVVHACHACGRCFDGLMDFGNLEEMYAASTKNAKNTACLHARSVNVVHELVLHRQRFEFQQCNSDR